jgi:hypothetical protein
MLNHMFLQSALELLFKHIYTREPLSFSKNHHNRCTLGQWKALLNKARLYSLVQNTVYSAADPGFLSRIRIFPSRIPVKEIPYPGSESA